MIYIIGVIAAIAVYCYLSKNDNSTIDNQRALAIAENIYKENLKEGVLKVPSFSLPHQVKNLIRENK